MIKVKWLKAHFKFAYVKGDVGYVTPEWAEKLIEGGYIMLVPEVEVYHYTPTAIDSDIPKTLPVNPLPEDIPCRDKLFAAGYTKLEDIAASGDSLLDAGISNANLKKIKSYLKKK